MLKKVYYTGATGLVALWACSDGDTKDAGPGDGGIMDHALADTGPAADTGIDAGDAGDAGEETPDSGLLGNWACLDSVTWNAPVRQSALIRLNFDHFEAGNVETPAPGVRVAVCSGAAECLEPSMTASTAADGNVDVAVPTPMPHGFEGFLRVTQTGYVPSSLFLLPPIYDNFVRWSGPWAVVSPAALGEWATGAGTTLDPNKGRLFVLTADCDYLGRTTPASDTEELEVFADGRAADGRDGYAHFFWNIDPGPVEVEVKLQGRTVGRSTRFVVAGEITQGVLGPTPLD